MVMGRRWSSDREQKWVTSSFLFGKCRKCKGLVSAQTLFLKERLRKV